MLKIHLFIQNKYMEGINSVEHNAHTKELEEQNGNKQKHSEEIIKIIESIKNEQIFQH